MKYYDCCELCGVYTHLTEHHLIPQVKNKKVKKSDQNTIWICSLCHTTIHAKFDNNFLRDFLNTKEAILNNEDMQTYLNWRSKHPNFESNSTKLKRH